MSLMRSATAGKVTLIRAVVFFSLFAINLFLAIPGRTDARDTLVFLVLSGILFLYAAGVFLPAFFESVLHLKLSLSHARYPVMLVDLFFVAGIAVVCLFGNPGTGPLISAQYYIALVLLLVGTILRRDPLFSIVSGLAAIILYIASALPGVLLGGTPARFPWDRLLIHSGGLFIVAWVVYLTAEYLRTTHNEAEASRNLFDGMAQNFPGIIVQLEIVNENRIELRYLSESAYVILEQKSKQPSADNMAGLLSELHAQLQPRLREMIQESFSLYGQISLEVELATGSGKRWFSLMVSPSFQKDGRCMMNGLLLDIHDRKESEAALVRARDAAQSANRIKSDFLANMSHELRTPLNGVIGMVDLLLESDLSDEQSEFSETIRSSAESLLFIINDVLDFAKLEAGKLKIYKKSFHVYTLVQLVIETFYNQARDKDVALRLDYDPRIPDYMINDDNRIKQVLYNLVGNAVKFTSEGWVTVTVGFSSTKNGESALRFSVEDTGPGISSENLPRIFEKFSQVDTSLTRAHGGTGLGLAISSELVMLLGGKLEVTSSPGHGSCFEFVLPMGVDSASRQLDGLEGLRVHIVDPDYGRREVLKKFLSFYGANVSGDAAGDFPDTELAAVIAVITDHAEACAFADALDRKVPDSACLFCIVDSNLRAVLRSHLKAGWQLRNAPPDCYRLAGDLALTKSNSCVDDDSDILSSRGGRVLLAEDNPVNQKVLEKILSRLGCSVDLAADGVQALDSLRRQQYDLVFMDCQMPVLDGISAVELLRQEGNDTPIIALTGLAMPGDREKMLKAGMTDYLSKPVKIHEIAAVINRWIPGPAILQPGSVRFDHRSQLLFSPQKAAKALGGDLDDVAEIATLFIDDNVPRVNAFFEQYRSSSRTDCRLFFHRLKGAAQTIQARQFVGLCDDLEKVAEDLTDRDFFNRVEILKKSFFSLVDSVKDWLVTR